MYARNVARLSIGLINPPNYTSADAATFKQLTRESIAVETANTPIPVSELVHIVTQQKL